jgi:hypothetical protein
MNWKMWTGITEDWLAVIVGLGLTVLIVAGVLQNIP